MAETIGTITNIKVMNFLEGSVNAFDTCSITLKETSTGTSWLFYIWNSREDDLPVHRVTATQRLALAREAAFRKLTVHVFADASASVLHGFQVDLP
jgi:hypothetical protein